MDTNTAVILVIALLVLAVVAAFAVYRSRAKVDINSPLGSVKIDASNDPPPIQPAIVVEDATSHGGGLLAEDKTGRGVTAKTVNVQDDILISSEAPQDNNPKA